MQNRFLPCAARLGQLKYSAAIASARASICGCTVQIPCRVDDEWGIFRIRSVAIRVPGERIKNGFSPDAARQLQLKHRAAIATGVRTSVYGRAVQIPRLVGHQAGIGLISVAAVVVEAVKQSISTGGPGRSCKG